MEKMHRALRFFRPVLYVVAGVLPALGFTFLGLHILGFDHALGISINMLASLGSCGLMFAALNRPSSIGARCRLVITVLLMMGLLAISPLALVLLSSGGGKLWFNAAIIGPTLLALHYAWQVTRISSLSERYILAFISAILFGTPTIGYLVMGGVI